MSNERNRRTGGRPAHSSIDAIAETEGQCDICGAPPGCPCNICPDCGRSGPCGCYDDPGYGDRASDRLRIQSLIAKLAYGWQDMDDAAITKIANTIDTIARKNVRWLNFRLPERHAIRRVETITWLVEGWELMLHGRAAWADVQILAHTVALHFDPSDDACDSPCFFPGDG